MSELERVAELERLIQLFLHDVRSPLGVAQGYMSLLGGQALSLDERIRAQRSVTDAITRISTLLEDVTTLITPAEADGLEGSIDASLLCERVSIEAGRRGMSVVSRAACDSARVRVGTSIDRVSEAITIMLSPTERMRRAAPGPLNLAISNNGRELGFTIGDHGAVHPHEPEFEPFDAAAIGSVEHLKAYRHISLLGGQVWREVGQTRAYGVTLPLSA